MDGCGWLWLVGRAGWTALCALAGCSSGAHVPDAGAPDAANAGFIRPTEITLANERVDGIWRTLGTANWSCLDLPSDEQPSTVSIALTGTTRDYQTDDVVATVAVAAFDSNDTAGTAPLAQATSDRDGLYAMTLPPGVTRLLFRSTDPEPTQRFVDSYLLDHRPDPMAAMQSLDLHSVSWLSMDWFPFPLPVLTGSIIDCDGYPVEHAIATFSTASGEPFHLPGAQTYYFSAGSTSLPVRHSQQPDTNHDGLFLVTEAPATPAVYVQVWGFVDGQDPETDDLMLLAELPSPLPAETVIQAPLEPRRAP